MQKSRNDYIIGATMYKNFIFFLLSFSSCCTVEQKYLFDYIEFGIFENTSAGNLSGNPGIVFRIYSTGELLYYDTPHKFKKYNINEKTVKKLYRYIVKNLFREEKQYFIKKKGASISLHGGFVYLKCKRTMDDLLIISKYYPRDGALLSFLMRVQKIKNKCFCVSSNNEIKDHSFFEIVCWLANQEPMPLQD